MTGRITSTSLRISEPVTDTSKLLPASWKRHVYPARSVVFRATREGSGLLIEEPVRPRPRYAFIGVRSCEIAALAVLGGPLTQPNRVDPDFAASTEDLFVVAVSCGSPATTCFCTSAGTGPRAATGYDIRLAEIMGQGPTHFFAEAGSAAGAALLARMDLPAAGASDAAAAEDVTAVAVAAMGARVDLAAAPEVLARSHDHPRWEEVGERCLACGNCTMSCPTCFCVDVVDENPFDEDGAVRVREWSSCFGIPFSEMHGGVVRTSVSARYRQWLTHKMSSWVDQFGTLGCVGCGRCITMCPAGIDIRDELTAILATNDGAGAESS